MQDQVLNNTTLQALRSNGTISDQEVVISEGDLYYAKNVLTNDKRMLTASVVNSAFQNEAITENKRTLLKG